MRLFVICSFCLIADHNVECSITDRLFKTEATLIKVLHCLFSTLYVILFNTFIHSFQSLALNRFNIKHHVGSTAGAVVRALASHRCGPGLTLSSVHMWALLLLLSLLREVFPRVLRFYPQQLALLNSNSTRNARTPNTRASGSLERATTPRVIELKQLI